MEIIDLSNYNETRFNTAIALGNFDGIHIGHQQLINTMISKAKDLGIKSSLLLFKNHTKATIDNNKPNMITSNEQKFKICEELGIDIIYLLDFDDNLMKLSGEDFIKNIIIDKMNCKLLVVGFDYRFGYKASGDSEFLLELGKKHNIDVIVLDPVYKNNEVISSSIIRNLIAIGHMDEVTNILGRPYSILGKVITGKNRGNKLGFPTANMEPMDNFVIPKNGVYITNTIVDNRRYLSATNIGYNPTFNEDVLKIETYILDFGENIYGKMIEVEFIDFLRDDIKFKNKEELINQMNLDIEMVKFKH
ncbi:bifunctional riboflavin kinase/FAD synthetase [Tissierella sp. MB52-C2]|uniref:bifunctional riboflavin kinase/FAD synthetase n=1 Tax=Tissierella sp. MB52-C2 TaxID=3070999 RepID=UPI00280B931A|nr:bifunctional riboflavin kinase/FAD synthetase [Tissierella sp. MB52-C2]WMM26576.1 bifunctional riboflavin kinase/FAD synthetase [Tissierella sp. MB52-C2]